MIRKAVIKRIKDLLAAAASGQDEQEAGPDEVRLAVAALLVEAAKTDHSFDAEERRRVLELVAARFHLSQDEAEALVVKAEAETDDAVQLHGFTRVAKDSLSYEERVGLMEMLWEVAYADGTLHDFEANLMRRISGLLFVSDRDSGSARKRARRRAEQGA